jgi:hypothetical protein
LGNPVSRSRPVAQIAARTIKAFDVLLVTLIFTALT